MFFKVLIVQEFRFYVHRNDRKTAVCNINFVRKG